MLPPTIHRGALAISCWLALVVPLAAQAEEQAGEKRAPAAKAVDSKPSGGKGGQAGLFREATIQVGQKKRADRLFVPKSVDLGKPAPLVFAFHGFLDSKDLMPFYSQLDKLAEEKGFILVYPNGEQRRWVIVPEWAKDDLDFFDALYAELIAQYNIDLRRVFLIGMSNGAFFSHLVASQRPDKIAAIAPHSGGLGVFTRREIAVKPKYAVFIIHGVEDSIVNVAEGRKTMEAYKKWGHAVEYLEVPGQNHFWAHKADVNHKIWNFFLAHPLTE